MRFLGCYQKARAELAADVAEVADLCLDIHAETARFEIFRAAPELDVAVRRQDLSCRHHK